MTFIKRFETRTPHTVEVVEHRQSAFARYFELQAVYGDARASFVEGIYNIQSIDVASQMRRQGVGKAILECAYSHAQELEARVVIAGIISRECLKAMTQVFGEEAVIVHAAGSYAPQGEDYNQNDPTLASLYLPLHHD